MIGAPQDVRTTTQEASVPQRFNVSAFQQQMRAAQRKAEQDLKPEAK
jgi:hypothetical protein